MKNNLLVYILLCLLNLSWANARNKQQEAEALIKKSVEALYNNPCLLYTSPSPRDTR